MYYREEELIELRDIPIPQHRLNYIRDHGYLPIFKRRTGYRGLSGIIYVSQDVAATLLILDNAGLPLSLVHKFSARLHPITDDIVLTYRAVGDQVVWID